MFKKQHLIEDCQKAEKFCSVQIVFLNCSKFGSFVMWVTLMYKSLLNLACHFCPWASFKGSNNSDGEPVLLPFPSFLCCNSCCLTGTVQNFMPAVTTIPCCNSLLADFPDTEFFFQYQHLVRYAHQIKDLWPQYPCAQRIPLLHGERAGRVQVCYKNLSLHSNIIHKEGSSSVRYS